MVYDHAQSPRLGQPAPVESTGIRIFNGSTLPEVAYPGQMIYRSDIKVIQVYNTDAGAWENVVGGVAGQLTFVAPEPPMAINVNDLWYDSDDGHRLYQWDGTNWIPVLLGPGSIGTKAIRAEHLDADAINGVTFTGNTFRTAAAGARIELGPNGLVFFDAAEAQKQVATMGGDINAGVLSVDGTATFNDLVAIYDRVLLNDGITNPQNKPVLTTGWRYVNSTGGTLSKTAWVGLSDNVGGASWATAHEGYGADAQTQPKIIFIDKTTGAITENALTWSISGSSNPRTALGYTRIASNYYLLTRDYISGSTAYYLHKFNNVFNESAAFNISSSLSVLGRLQEWILGTDGTSAIVVANTSNNAVQIKRFNVLTGAVSSSSSLALNKPAEITAYWSGSADFGAARQVMCTQDATTTRVADTANTATRYSASEWNLAASNQQGIWWDGTRFWTLDSQGKIVRHSIITADQTETWSYAWSDGSTGRSPASPPSTIVRLARQYVHIKVPTPPVGLQACVYGGVGVGVRTLQSTYAPGVTESDEGTTVTATPTIEQTTSTLTVSYTPGSVAANVGGFSVDGKSNGSIGTGTLRDSVDARFGTFFRAGSYTTGAFSGSTDRTVVITFGTPFPTGSTVHGWVESAAPGNANPVSHSVSAISRTSMTIKINRPGSTSAVTFHWYATSLNSAFTSTES